MFLLSKKGELSNLTSGEKMKKLSIAVVIILASLSGCGTNEKAVRDEEKRILHLESKIKQYSKILDRHTDLAISSIEADEVILKYLAKGDFGDRSKLKMIKDYRRVIDSSFANKKQGK